MTLGHVLESDGAHTWPNHLRAPPKTLPPPGGAPLDCFPSCSRYDNEVHVILVAVGGKSTDDVDPLTSPVISSP